MSIIESFYRLSQIKSLGRLIIGLFLFGLHPQQSRQFDSRKKEFFLNYGRCPVLRTCDLARPFRVLG